jgi:hypothetical protein
MGKCNNFLDANFAQSMGQQPKWCRRSKENPGDCPLSGELLNVPAYPEGGQQYSAAIANYFNTKLFSPTSIKGG